MDDQNAFELTKREFAAVCSFTGGPRKPPPPILFRPSAKDPKWPSKQASHIVSTDGHTMATMKDEPFDGEDFWVSREVAQLLKTAIPTRGYILLSKQKGLVHFAVHRGKHVAHDKDVALIKGGFEEPEGDEKMAAGYVEFGESKIPKQGGGKGALQTRYLSRLESVRKAVGHCLGAEIFTGKSELDPVHFLFRNSKKLARWHVVIMPYRH